MSEHSALLRTHLKHHSGNIIWFSAPNLGWNFKWERDNVTLPPFYKMQTVFDSVVTQSDRSQSILRWNWLNEAENWEEEGEFKFIFYGLGTLPKNQESMNNNSSQIYWASAISIILCFICQNKTKPRHMLKFSFYG